MLKKNYNHSILVRSENLSIITPNILNKTHYYSGLRALLSDFWSSILLQLAWSHYIGRVSSTKST